MESKYIGSYPNHSISPHHESTEFAFIGRSNVGKSSLINFLTGRKNLALVSSSPGKTKMINFFEIDESWYLVDLPGYGYATSSKKDRGKWKKMIYDYFEFRKELTCVMVLIDSNISPQEIDIQMINWLGSKSIPFVLIFTKSDKSKSPIIKENIEEFKARLRETWEDLPHYFITSSKKRIGNTEVLNFIFDINNNLGL